MLCENMNFMGAAVFEKIEGDRILAKKYPPAKNYLLLGFLSWKGEILTRRVKKDYAKNA